MYNAERTTFQRREEDQMFWNISYFPLRMMLKLCGNYFGLELTYSFTGWPKSKFASTNGYIFTKYSYLVLVTSFCEESRFWYYFNRWLKMCLSNLRQALALFFAGRLQYSGLYLKSPPLWYDNLISLESFT